MIKIRIMNRINVKKIMADKGLSATQLGKVLYPNNRYPHMAVARLLKEDAALNSDQVDRLANYLGVGISQLYDGAGAWSWVTHKNVHTFTNGEYTAYLDINTFTTRLFHNNSMYHEAIIHSKQTTLSEYLDNINYLIIKHKQENEYK